MKSQHEAFDGADKFFEDGEAAINSVESSENGRESAATQLVKLATQDTRLFTTPDDEAFATFKQAGHDENWPIASREFTGWLGQRYFKTAQRVVPESTLQDAKRTLAGLAKYEGDRHDVYLRVAPWEDGFLIDLCDDRWRAVFVGPGEVKVLDKSPVKFWRTATMLPLPTPDDDAANVDRLFEFVNAADNDRDTVLTWACDAFRPSSPYCVLEIIGQQGSGKSKQQEIIRSTVDPSTAPLMGKPKSVDDMFVAASKEHVLSMDNLSGLSADFQDELCRLATGGGRKQRALYTNADVHALNVKRPVMMNGITILATRPDLIDRVVQVEVPVIQRYRKESALMADVGKARPVIFSGLMQLLAEALDWVGHWDAPRNLRQQDFIELGQAVSHVRHGDADRFVRRYVDMRQDALLHALEGDPVIQALMHFVHVEGGYSGLQGNLLKKLMAQAGVKSGARDWPTDRGFKNRLKRAIPALELADIRIRFDPQRKPDGYHVTVEKIDRQPTQPTQRTSGAAENVRHVRCVRSDAEKNTGTYEPGTGPLEGT